MKNLLDEMFDNPLDKVDALIEEARDLKDPIWERMERQSYLERDNLTRMENR